VEVDTGLSGADFGALGIIVGKEAGSRIPLFRLRDRPQLDELKALGAAMAASGAVALYHVAGVTPEAGAFEPPAVSFTVTRSDIDFVKGCGCEPELIAFGCPHCSEAELRRLSCLLKGRKVKKEVWVFTSRAVGEHHPELVESIRASGAKVFYDTCMVVSPASNRFKCIMVDSGKAHAYIPGMCGAQSQLASTEDCLRAALN